MSKTKTRFKAGVDVGYRNRAIMVGRFVNFDAWGWLWGLAWRWGGSGGGGWGRERELGVGAGVGWGEGRGGEGAHNNSLRLQPRFRVCTRSRAF